MLNNQDVIKLLRESFISQEEIQFLCIRKHERGGTAHQYSDQVTGCMTAELGYDSQQGLEIFLATITSTSFYSFPRD
jgi:hypothetical protein